MTAANPSRPSEWNKIDWQIASALFIVTFLSRIPFRTTLFYAWDSVLYARAIDHFDVSMRQPHPPGHIFYVFLSRAVNLITGDPNSAMVWVSVFFSAAAVAALYWLGTMMYDRPVGLVASLLLATSLSFWAYSEVAYPYTLLAFLVTIFAGLIYGARKTQSAVFILLAAPCLGIGSGFRQDMLPFMLPLMAYGLYGMPWRRWLAAAVLLGAGVVSWYLPSALLSGGFAVYREQSSEQSAYIIEKISVFGRGFDAVTANLHDLGWFSLLALAAATPLMLIFITDLFLPRLRGMRRDGRLLFLLIWTVPSVLFYILVHIGEFGYVFSFLPAVLLAATWGTANMAALIAEKRGDVKKGATIFALVSATIIFANLMAFLVLTPSLSANRLAARDGILRSRLDTIKQDFDPRTTFIVSVFDYQQAAFYLPDYQVWQFDPLEDSYPSTEIPEGVKQVVIFENYLKPGDDEKKDIVPLEYDQELFVIYPAGRKTLKVDWPSRKVELADE